MKKYDVIVVGGGFAGCAAAIAAARNGCEVLVIEQAGALGGAANNCLVNPFMRNATKIHKENGETERLELSRGIFAEICEKLNSAGAMQKNRFHEEYLKIILDNMTADAGVDVLFRAVGVEEVAAQIGDLVAVPAHDEPRRLRYLGKHGRFEVFGGGDRKEALHVFGTDDDSHSLLRFGDRKLGAVKTFVFLGNEVKIYS